MSKLAVSRRVMLSEDAVTFLGNLFPSASD
jgi:hypothetical protein